MTVRHKCSTKIRGAYKDVSGPVYPCHRPATVQHDGKWYCWQHDPRRIAKKAAERRADWEAKGNRETAKYARIARNARLGALVTPELAALLEPIEYSPGTYCGDVRCKHYSGGQFDTHCNDCSAYVFYLWLQEHGYRLLKVSRGATALAACIREALAQEVNE